MARPKSDERRSAILSAAARVIASQGLSAPTAMIAKEAGVSNGSLFTYFETKADLLNQLFVELKIEMGEVALEGLPPDQDLRGQMLHMWSRWLHWAASHPQEHRTLMHLSVADDITPESHSAVGRALTGMAGLVERSREAGPLRDAPLGLVVSLMTALADATVDFMIQAPRDADQHCRTAFDAMWRMLS